jgi:Domain of Unknown Function (DUF1080)
MSRFALNPVSAVLAALILLNCRLDSLAAEPKLPDPTEPEFVAQGEYAGEFSSQMGSTSIGVQVVAEDEGKVRSVSYIGGLPGDGWDRSSRHAGKSAEAGDVTEFKGDGEYSASLKNGVFTISKAGLKIAELKKAGRTSPTLGAAPPEGAIVLFDGSDASKFENGKMDDDFLLLPGCVSTEKFGSGKLHVEFRVPFQPALDGQNRGNSGVFLQGRYEVQILDSFGLEESDRGCGALYAVKEPEQNMCYPPFAWQTFDIDFAAPEFKDGKKVEGSQAGFTVRHNGTLIHRKAKLAQPSGGAKFSDEAETGPIYLQDHRSPVRFQNIWFLPKSAEEKK